MQGSDDIERCNFLKAVSEYNRDTEISSSEDHDSHTPRKRTSSETALDDMMGAIAIHGADDDFSPRNVDLGCLLTYFNHKGLRFNKSVFALLADKSPGSLYDKMVEELPFQVRIANNFSGRVEPWGRLNGSSSIDSRLRDVIMKNTISSGSSGRVIQTKWFSTYSWLYFSLPFSDQSIYDHEEQLEKVDWGKGGLLCLPCVLFAGEPDMKVLKGDSLINLVSQPWHNFKKSENLSDHAKSKLHIACLEMSSALSNPLKMNVKGPMDLIAKGTWGKANIVEDKGRKVIIAINLLLDCQGLPKRGHREPNFLAIKDVVTDVKKCFPSNPGNFIALVVHDCKQNPDLLKYITTCNPKSTWLHHSVQDKISHTTSGTIYPSPPLPFLHKTFKYITNDRTLFM